MKQLPRIIGFIFNKVMSSKLSGSAKLTREEILRMPLVERTDRVSIFDAKIHNLVVVDGPHGSVQFVGTAEENQNRINEISGVSLMSSRGRR